MIVLAVVINNTFDKADDIIKRSEEKQKDYDSSEVSNTWSDYEVSVNNKTIKLPCTYEELKDATGFSMKSADEKSYLSKNYYATVNMYNLLKSIIFSLKFYSFLKKNFIYHIHSLFICL